MRFVAVHRAFMLTSTARDASTSALGSWLRLQSYCGSDGVENPRLPGVWAWTDRQWLASANVTRSEVAEVVAAGLASWDGEDLTVEGYDQDGANKIKTLRNNGKYGALGGRPKGKKNPEGKNKKPSGFENETPVTYTITDPKKDQIGEEAKAEDGLRLVLPSVVIRPGPDASGEAPRKRRTVAAKTGALFGDPVPAVPGPRDVIGWFCDAWKAAKGKPYKPTDRDAGRCRDALKKFSAEDVAELPGMFSRYVADQNKFLTERGHDLAYFFSSINAYTPGGTANATAKPIGVHRVMYGKPYEGEAGHYEGEVFHPAKQEKAK